MARPRKVIRDNISRAVHEAVSEMFGNDGIGRCMYYSFAGALLASRVIGKPYYPQAGILNVVCDPAEPELCWAMDPTQHADPFIAGEFHCWIVQTNQQESKGDGRFELNEVVDLSSRHYKAMHGRGLWLGGQRLQWKRPDPPEYIWTTNNVHPEWVHFYPDENTIEYQWQHIAENKTEFDELKKLAFDKHETLVKPIVRRNVKPLRAKRKTERQRKKKSRLRR